MLPHRSVTVDPLKAVLDAIRHTPGMTRPQVGAVTGLGRTVVTQRVARLIDAGLVIENEPQPAVGRPAAGLQLASDSGALVVIEIGAAGALVSLSDLGANIQPPLEAEVDVRQGPEGVLSKVEELIDKVLSERDAQSPPLLGVGIGVPGPVEHGTGRSLVQGTLPGWDGYPVAQRLEKVVGVPAWVDNEVNLMALGEMTAGLGRGVNDLVFVKVGFGIGAGLISQGKLHRGANGCAGDIGHTRFRPGVDTACWCGKKGCFEAVASGHALGRLGGVAAESGESTYLARLRQEGPITAKDVADGARYGDPFCVAALHNAGLAVGEMLAPFVDFFNPAVIVVGGGVAKSGDRFLAAIRQSIYRLSLPLATRNLLISSTALPDIAGLKGAASMVIEDLLASENLAAWAK